MDITTIGLDLAKSVLCQATIVPRRHRGISDHGPRRHVPRAGTAASRRIKSSTRLQERCEVMANGSDRSWDTPPHVQGTIACIADWTRLADSIRASSSLTGCTNRPKTRLLPTHAKPPYRRLQCGSHPDRTRAR